MKYLFPPKPEVDPPVVANPPANKEVAKPAPKRKLVAEPSAIHRQYTRSVADNFDIQDLTQAQEKYPVGQKILFKYNLANVAKKPVTIPPSESGKGGVDQNILAARQHWIEFLDGKEGAIPVLDGSFLKIDNRYQVSVILLLNEGKRPMFVKRDEKLPCTGEVQTDGFPAGRYRYTVELHGMKLRTVVSRQELKFEIMP